MSKHSDEIEKAIKKVKETGEKLSKGEMALLVSLHLQDVSECARKLLKEEFEVPYIARESKIGLQAVHHFLNGANGTRISTLAPLARVYAYLAIDPPPETHLGRIGAKEKSRLPD